MPKSCGSTGLETHEPAWSLSDGNRSMFTKLKILHHWFMLNQVNGRILAWLIHQFLCMKPTKLGQKCNYNCLMLSYFSV